LLSRCLVRNGVRTLQYATFASASYKTKHDFQVNTLAVVATSPMVLR